MRRFATHHPIYPDALTRQAFGTLTRRFVEAEGGICKKFGRSSQKKMPRCSLSFGKGLIQLGGHGVRNQNLR
jgi:hypothetical protein